MCKWARQRNLFKSLKIINLMNYRQKVILSQKDLKIIELNESEVITKAKFGPSKETRIPLYLNENLSFFVAAIIGDGHLRKSKLQINIELSDKKLINYLRDLCRILFNREFNVRTIRKRVGKKQSYQMVMDSKAIYSLLNNTFGIPVGKKSRIVSVPELILRSNDKNIKKSFLIGIMVTEGGKRMRQVGLSTASKKLWECLAFLFEDVGIKIRRDKWIYQKYKKEYYGISFRREDLISLMRGCRSGQTGQFLLNTILKEGQA